MQILRQKILKSLPELHRLLSGAKSGLLPEADVCDKDPRGTQSYTEYFAEGTVPTENCDHHISLQICEASGKVAGEYCPADQVVTKLILWVPKRARLITSTVRQRNF